MEKAFRFFRILFYQCPCVSGFQGAQGRGQGYHNCRALITMQRTLPSQETACSCEEEPGQCAIVNEAMRGSAESSEGNSSSPASGFVVITKNIPDSRDRGPGESPAQDSSLRAHQQNSGSSLFAQRRLFKCVTVLIHAKLSLWHLIFFMILTSTPLSETSNNLQRSIHSWFRLKQLLWSWRRFEGISFYRGLGLKTPPFGLI